MVTSQCPSLSGERLLASGSGDLASLTCVMVKDRAWGGGGRERVGGKEMTEFSYIFQCRCICTETGPRSCFKLLIKYARFSASSSQTQILSVLSHWNKS